MKTDVQQANLQSATSDKPFNEAVRELQVKGYRIISMEEQAGLRVQEGRTHPVSKEGNFTQEGWIHSPNTMGTYLVKKSPLIKHLDEVYQTHVKGDEFNIQSNLEGALLVPYGAEIPTNRFAENDITVFMFGKNAENYGNFLTELGRKTQKIWTPNQQAINSQTDTFARQNWMTPHYEGPIMVSETVYNDISKATIRGVKE